MTEPIVLTAASVDRLDRTLADGIEHLSRSRLQALIEAGQVCVNDTPCTQKKYKLKPGDRVAVVVPEAEPLDTLVPLAIDLDILYEDDDLLVVDKPAGLVVHPAPGHAQDTLVNALLYHCGDRLSGIGGRQRPGIVHRLDKDTTGAIVVAKTDLAHQHLQAQIAAKTARREYLGIVYGSPRTDTGTVALPVGRHPQDRKKMAVVEVDRGGRQAVTHWRVLERLGNHTTMHFQLETGRTHQIRVHSAAIGHPIVGDPLYASGRAIGVNLPGQALHAWKLTLIHPRTGAQIAAVAEPPLTFDKLLRVLRNRRS
ncbi:MAG: RluA family pseudouridine synthase [Geitlerinemataceae cyanobacterium]